jgi:hypothetical protein
LHRKVVNRKHKSPANWVVAPLCCGVGNGKLPGRAGFATEDVFPGNGQSTSQDGELRRLQRENERLRQERDFLKQAAVYFVKAWRERTPASWELIADSDWHTHAEPKRAIFEYIEVWYNQKRRHSALGYKSPAEYEIQLALTRRAG